MKIGVLVLVVAALGVGFNCNPPSTPDAGPGPTPPAPVGGCPTGPGDCNAACAALAAVPCPLGTSPTCASFMLSLVTTSKQANPKTACPITCTDVAAVKTAADAKALGFGCQ